MSLWDSLFGHLSQPIAQILLTRNDIADVSAIRGPCCGPKQFLMGALHLDFLYNICRRKLTPCFLLL